MGNSIQLGNLLKSQVEIWTTPLSLLRHLVIFVEASVEARKERKWFNGWRAPTLFGGLMWQKWANLSSQKWSSHTLWGSVTRHLFNPQPKTTTAEGSSEHMGRLTSGFHTCLICFRIIWWESKGWWSDDIHDSATRLLCAYFFFVLVGEHDFLELLVPICV